MHLEINLAQVWAVNSSICDELTGGPFEQGNWEYLFCVLPRRSNRNL